MRPGWRSGCSSPRDTDARLRLTPASSQAKCGTSGCSRSSKGSWGEDERTRSGRAMKVVIFCGGLGVRMGEETQTIPKPMITVGGRPILWHIMKWYASWGHDDFVLCLGYKARVHQGVLPQLQRGALERLRPLERRPRRRAARERHLELADHVRRHRARSRRSRSGCSPSRPHLEDDEYFLATYGDGLTDAPLPDMIERLQATGKTGLSSPSGRCSTRMSSTPTTTGVVRSVEDMQDADVRINGGFMVFRREILD